MFIILVRRKKRELSVWPGGFRVLVNRPGMKNKGVHIIHFRGWYGGVE